jgi:hypothetical protein
VREIPVAEFRAVTVAPETTAPFGSTTVPRKSAALTCACEKIGLTLKIITIAGSKMPKAMLEILKLKDLIGLFLLIQTFYATAIGENISNLTSGDNQIYLTNLFQTVLKVFCCLVFLI